MGTNLGQTELLRQFPVSRFSDQSAETSVTRVYVAWLLSAGVRDFPNNSNHF